jgi:transcriptional regulator with XRE-family HTH domain
LTVGERIRLARERLKMSQVGVSRGAIYNWETDKTDIRKDKIPKLASVLRIEPPALTPFGGVSAPINEDGDAAVVAYLRRIDNTVSGMAEDIDQIKGRLSELESRVTNLDKRLDGMQKRLDNISRRD